MTTQERDERTINSVTIRTREFDSSFFKETTEGSDPGYLGISLSLALDRHLGGELPAIELLLESLGHLYDWICGERTVAGESADAEFLLALKKYLAEIEQSKKSTTTTSARQGGRR